MGESIRSGHPSHDFFVVRYRRARAIYVRQFLALRKANLRDDVDLDEVATLIMAVTDGLQIQWLLDPEKVGFAGTFRLFSRIMVDYLED